MIFGFDFQRYEVSFSFLLSHPTALSCIGPLYTAEEGFLPDYAGGSYTLANNATLIVSRGLGDSSRAPRINNVPELSVIDID